MADSWKYLFYYLLNETIFDLDLLFMLSKWPPGSSFLPVLSNPSINGFIDGLFSQ